MEATSGLTGGHQHTLGLLLATIVASLQITQSVLESILCFDFREELTALLAGFKGRKDLFVLGCV